jgi:polysaccharide export outer membrane protein
MQSTPKRNSLGLLCCAAVVGLSAGCASLRRQEPAPQIPIYNAPRELRKVILPTYRIEPPDVLRIDAVQVVPKAPYHLRVLDSVVLQVGGTLPESPIGGIYVIEPGGMINLGNPYGRLRITGVTIDEAKVVIEQHLKKSLREPTVTVSLGEIAGQQQIQGEHLVGPDGTVTLGSYGNVSVVGKTVAEVKYAIEDHLSQFLESPELSVEVFGFNSKVYYIITQGAGLGDGATRLPITGNETVLDAITQINGLTSVSSKKIWVARPGRNPNGCDQILTVDWIAITRRGQTETNYQLLPGDRVYVAEDKLVAMDTFIGKVLAPAERIAGFISLGTSTVSGIRFFHRGNNFGGGGGFP